MIPADAEHPVAAHKWINSVLEPAAAGKEMNYHQYTVPVKGIQGVPDALAKDPIIAITNEQIERYETQLQTPKGQQLATASTRSSRPPTGPRNVPPEIGDRRSPPGGVLDPRSPRYSYGSASLAAPAAGLSGAHEKTH